MLSMRKISTVRDVHATIASEIPTMKDCWNTFDYVTANLVQWADAATVGQKLRESLIRLCSELELNINGLEKLNNSLISFADIQEEINKGNF